MKSKNKEKDTNHKETSHKETSHKEGMDKEINSETVNETQPENGDAEKLAELNDRYLRLVAEFDN